MARSPSKLTDKQKTYVDEVMKGAPKDRAAKKAGYINAQRPDTSLTVKAEIERARAEITDLTTLDRLKSIEGILDGIAMARMMSDPGNVIKGWTEVAKIMGHYAPEVKTINVNHSAQRLRSKFEALSDEELTKIANGEVIDVEAKQVH